jgi:outer membrane receptor protein involved in Fe transport
MMAVGDADRRQSYFEISDSLTHARGQHLLKVGAAFKRIVVDGTVADGVRGLYAFRSLDSFFAGRPDATRIMSGVASVDLAVSRASGFVQDHWTPAPALTLDAGVRFDVEAFPASLNMTSRHVSPRVGIAWTAGSECHPWRRRGTVRRSTRARTIERALSAAHDGIVDRSDPMRRPVPLDILRPGRGIRRASGERGANVSSRQT